MEDSSDFVARGRLALIRQQFAEAARICRLGLLQHPTVVEGRIVLGEALVQMRRWDDVLAEMRIALDIDSNDSRLLQLKGEALLGKGDFNQAERVLTRALSLNPDSARMKALVARVAQAKAEGWMSETAEPSNTRIYPIKLAPPAGDNPPPMVPMKAERQVPRMPADDSDPIELESGEIEFESNPERAPLPSFDSLATVARAPTPRRDRDHPTVELDPSFQRDATKESNPGEPPLSAEQGETLRSNRLRPIGTRQVDAPRVSESQILAEFVQPGESTVALPSDRARVLAAHTPARVAPLGVNVRPVTRKSLGRKSLPLAFAVLGIISLGVLVGVSLREWRLRNRLHHAEEQAQRRLAIASYPALQGADLDYQQMLSERDDRRVRSLRTRLLGQIAFEFGESPDAAVHAVAQLGDDGSEVAMHGRCYTVLAQADAQRAQQLTALLRRTFDSPLAGYLFGRSELLNERVPSAIDALRAASAASPRDALFWHGLGLAEAAAKHEDRALDAYRRALEINPTHIASLIDRGLIWLHRPAERDSAQGALSAVVTRLVGEASPAQVARAYVALGELELERGDLRAARRNLDLALAKRRDGDASVSEELARVFLLAFDLDQAEREAKRALAGSERIGPRLILAEVALKLGQPGKALSALEHAGAQSEIAVLRALANLQLHRVPAARADADTGLRLAPDSLSAKIAVARVAIAEGHAKQALKDLEEIEQSGKFAEVAAALGDTLSAQGKYERAQIWYAEALRRQPLMLDAHLALAQVLRKAGHGKEAGAALQRILQTDAGYLPARRELAELALSEGDATLARDELDAIAEKAPEPQILLASARAHLALGDAVAAADRVRKAQKLGDDSVAAQGLLGAVLVFNRRKQEAIDLFSKIPVGDLSGAIVADWALAYLDANQPERAAQVLAIAPAANGGPEIALVRARIEAEQGRSQPALALASAVARRGSRLEQAAALGLMGRIQWEQGSFATALQLLKQSTHLDSHQRDAFFYLAMVLEELHRSEDARSAMEIAVRNHPRFPDAWFYLAQYRARAKDPTALDAYRQYLELDPKGAYAEEARHALR